MTTTAHRSKRVYAGATRKAAHRPPPNRPSQRRPVSWLHCSTDKFLDLLAQHESGEIDLLAMPTDTDDEEDWGTEQE